MYKVKFFMSAQDYQQWVGMNASIRIIDVSVLKGDQIMLTYEQIMT